MATRARDLVNMDDASIEFLSSLGKPVHAAVLQWLPSHRSFLRRAARVSHALAVQGDGARTTVEHRGANVHKCCL